MPRPRAMMAVCEVHPPTSVANALMCVKSSSASVEGISSSATTTASSVRRRPSMLAPVVVLDLLVDGEQAVGDDLDGPLAVDRLRADDGHHVLVELAVFEHEEV